MRSPRLSSGESQSADTDRCASTFVRRPAVTQEIALGRINWVVIGSEVGGLTAAVLYSVIDTYKHLGIDPFPYLRDALPGLFVLGQKPTAEQLLEQPTNDVIRRGALSDAHAHLGRRLQLRATLPRRKIYARVLSEPFMNRLVLGLITNY
jgi:hypothetical protein